MLGGIRVRYATVGGLVDAPPASAWTVHSLVRTLIDSAAPGPQYTGLMSFGFGDFAADGTLNDANGGTIDSMHFAFGKKSFYGYWRQPDGSDASFSNFP